MLLGLRVAPVTWAARQISRNCVLQAPSLQWRLQIRCSATEKIQGDPSKEFTEALTLKSKHNVAVKEADDDQAPKPQKNFKKYIRSEKVKKLPSPGPKYSKAARRFYNERFRKPKERLSKVLAAAGVASRRASEEVIFAGKVTVNGKKCKVPETQVDPLRDTIYIAGKSLPRRLPPKLVFALYKPKGYICSDGKECKKSISLLMENFLQTWTKQNPGIARPRLFNVGRLDVGTSGLLLITNDGEFANKVAHPSSGITKEYIVKVGEKVTKRQVQKIIEGTEVDGVKCVPVSVEHITPEAGDTYQRLRVVVSEGRTHEVRLLIEKAHLQVQGLKRVRVGGFRLPANLSIGKYMQLNETQTKKVLEQDPVQLANSKAAGMLGTGKDKAAETSETSLVTSNKSKTSLVTTSKVPVYIPRRGRENERSKFTRRNN